MKVAQVAVRLSETGCDVSLRDLFLSVGSIRSAPCTSRPRASRSVR